MQSLYRLNLPRKMICLLPGVAFIDEVARTEDLFDL